MSAESVEEFSLQRSPFSAAGELGGPILGILELIDQIDEPGLHDPQLLRQQLTVIRERVATLAQTVTDLTDLTDTLIEQARRSPGAPMGAESAAPLLPPEIAAQVQELDEQRKLAEAQALRAIQDLKGLRANTKTEQTARTLAEAQQLRAIQDFRTEHRRAVKLAAELRAAYLHTITALARAVEARDQYTGGHVERVRRYSVRIGNTLGMAEDLLMHLEFGAVLHDVGKIGVPDLILGKTGPLDPEEWLFMRRHPEIGCSVLKDVGFLAPALDVVAYHHEQWDGGGYPAGLAGEQIPLAGRIVAVADTFDAMTSDRPYRRGLPLDVALAELERGKGTKYDPMVIEAFMQDPSVLTLASSDGK
jgi:HD-GYP domain-containing protein (c-di-GMP phosphodiesterase class II)